jgi:hypothetical protein
MLMECRLQLFNFPFHHSTNHDENHLKKIISIIFRCLTFFSLLSIIQQCHAKITIKKCCAAAERFNYAEKKCVPNTYNKQFQPETMLLTYNRTNWTAKVQYLPYTQTFKLCEGDVTADSGFTVQQNGALVKYVAGQNYHQFYNDFCVDVEYRMGSRVAVICATKKVIKKCCQTSQKLVVTPEESYDFHCQPTNESIFLNDNFIKGFAGGSNIEYSIGEISEFNDYQMIRRFSLSDFQFDQDTMIGFKNQTDFCLDRMNDRWISLVKIKVPTGAERGIPILCLISVFGVLIALLCNTRILCRMRLCCIFMWIYVATLLILLSMEAISSIPAIPLDFNIPECIIFNGSFAILATIFFAKLVDDYSAKFKVSLGFIGLMVICYAILFERMFLASTFFIGEFFFLLDFSD